MTRFGMMWRRGFVLAASLALLASVVPAATFAQDASPAAGGEVTVMTYFSKDLGENALKELLAQFEAEAGITVNFVDVGHEDYKTGILIQLAGGNPPDAHTVWAGARTAFQVAERLAGTHRRDVGCQRPRQPVPPRHDRLGSRPTRAHKYLLPFGYHIRGHVLQPQGLRGRRRRHPDHLGRVEGRL